jgi:cation diffusion facilitator CzcD-associated flavoprotein CzcO
VSLSTFVGYGSWFQRHAVPQLESIEVMSVEPRRDRQFEVSLATGEEFVARRVVVAAGFAPHRFVPDELAGAGSHVSHTADHSSLAGFDGAHVAVLGAGQSAIESAALLHEHGAVPTIIARRAALAWNVIPDADRRSIARRIRAPLAGLGAGWKLWTYATLPDIVRRLPEESRLRIAFTTLGPAGAWWLGPRITPEIEVRTCARLLSVEAVGDRVRLGFADPATEPLEVDHVLAATGYRFRLERLPFLAPSIRESLELSGGSPRLSAAFESSVQGLYFVGLAAAPTFGPVMRFVCGAGFAARRVVSAAAAR